MRTFALFVLLVCGLSCFAEKYPLKEYEELTDTKAHDGPEVWAKMSAPVSLSWGSTDVRYRKLDVPDVKKTTRLQLKAWKGERVNAQAVLWTKIGLTDVSVSVSELKCGSSAIPQSAISTHFVRYVMTDEFGKGCDQRPDKTKLDSSLVADVLDINKTLDVKACSTQPLWVKVWVPTDAKAGPHGRESRKIQRHTDRIGKGPQADETSE